MSERHTSSGHTGAGSDGPTGQLRPPPGLTVEVVGLTDKGRVRSGNEDSLIFEDPSTLQARTQGTLLVVSDGMGGHAAGEVASKIAVETIHSTYYRNRGMPSDAAVRDAIAQANAAIYEAAQQNRERAGMGCTVVALVVQGGDLTIGHVGDSRAYLIRAGQATQLTLDHSWVAMQVHEGILTPEQAEHHPNRSVLMRALGRQASVEIDIAHRQLQPGDVLLVCSDGLTGMVTDAEIAEFASRFPAVELPRQLVDLANSRGAPDNVTVLIGVIGGTLTAAQVAARAKALDPNNATAVFAAPQDARTPVVDAPDSDSPTDRNLRRPPADATLPMGAVPTNPKMRQDAQPAVPAPSTPAASPVGVPAAGGPATGAQRGRPVVVSRSSVTHADGPPARRRGRGRWIAGAVAAFGLAGALVLISIFQLSREGATSQTATGASGTPAPAAAPPAVKADPLMPAPTVPPPISSQLPGVTSPPGAGAQAVPPAAPAIQATPPALVATAPASPAAGGSPAAVTPTPNFLLTAVPTVRSIFATVVPTLSGGGPRTSEAPTTSSDAPASAPAPGTEGGDSGPAPATTSPSTDDAPAPGEPSASDPAPEAAGPPPTASADGARSGSDLCARGSAVAPGLAARAGCKPSNSNSSD